ncbi:MAG TPA: UDP-N-acetylglucosamine 1-carboxyvinyltransferase [Anaerolineae bacterium]|jgi:UDP-N-acetylglucosamine 1-carboxyvinyltransferase
MSTQQAFIIKGKAPLHGDLPIDGNKNAALPLIAATVLFPADKVVLKRVPQIRDVTSLCHVLSHMRADISMPEPEILEINTANLDPSRIDHKAWGEIRAAILLVGPLLSRFGRIAFPTPGGDVIGRRRLDSHLLALKEMGVTVEVYQNEFVVSTPAGRLKPAYICLDEPSVTGTENILMAAAVTAGMTTLYNAACEPHIQDLAHFLVRSGAKIEGIGSNRLLIHGSPELRPPDSFNVGADYIQVGAFIGIALCTRSELRLRNVDTEFMKPIQVGLARFGVTVQIEGNDIIVPGNQRLKIVEDAGARLAKLDSHPWPGFPSDLTSTAVVLATQTEGSIIIHEKLYESRLFFTDKLVRMGARITLCDPHRAIIIGPTNLFGANLESPDIRAGIALITAALCAEGETQIGNIGQIDRGFYAIEKKLAAVGAQIERI